MLKVIKNTELFVENAIYRFETKIFSNGLRRDQTVVLHGFYARKDYPDKLRRIRYFDRPTNKALVFLTNNFTSPALTIAQLYRCRSKQLT